MPVWSSVKPQTAISYWYRDRDRDVVLHGDAQPSSCNGRMNYLARDIAELRSHVYDSLTAGVT